MEVRIPTSHDVHASLIIAINPSFPVFLFFMWCKVSKATKMLSEVTLSDWKALWYYEITIGRRLLSWLAITFEINLYQILHRAIGQNLVTLSGHLTLGIRVTHVWLMLAGILPAFKQDSTEKETLAPMLPQ